jgi:hypothetical protein
MRYLALLFTLGATMPIYAAKQVSRLVAPPPGATLPISIVNTIKSNNLKTGQIVTARFFQRVPVTAVSYLPGNVELIGHVVSSTPPSLGILFTQLRWKHQVVPIHVRLVAAASSYNVLQTRMPLGASEEGTGTPADWTTRQVGGDEVYLSAGSGEVYDLYSQPVGYANVTGVYQDPSSPGGEPRAMGPFSTTATGLHGLSGFSIVSQGDADTPITLGVSKPKWQIASGAALLLEVVP